MKRWVLLIIATGMTMAQTMAARTAPATGRIVDDEGTPVAYATVVLLHGTEQAAGTATDTEGRFVLKAPAGEYTLSVQFLGYEPLTRRVALADGTDLGDLTLHTAATAIEEVEIRGRLIRREADRFVMEVANAPAAIGKDGIELLERAPGVWVDDEKISINGKTGSKVYVNDRELRMEPEQLLTYLRSLRAEEIQRIEVVPMTGAEEDADTAGGAIRITLRKRRENGLDGSVALRTQFSKVGAIYAPSANINAHSGGIDLYASAWYSRRDDDLVSDEQTEYRTSDAQLASHSVISGPRNDFGGRFGVVAQIAPRHSLGLEGQGWSNRGRSTNTTSGDFISGGTGPHTESRYDAHSRRSNYSAAFNYIWKIDTLGSTLKLLADYTRQRSDVEDDNRSSTLLPDAAHRDSLFRDETGSRYAITTATLALDKRFASGAGLKAGVKFADNDMHDAARYEYLRGEAWLRNGPLCFDIAYTERIAAAYGIFSGSFGRLSLVAGLRGEYTSTQGRGSGVDKAYFSLFPNANLSYALRKDGAHSLCAQYARTITRPGFWTLMPLRQQISDYTYQTGNPALEPQFTHDISLTLTLAWRYSLTAGVRIVTDEIQQTVLADDNDPNLLVLKWVNFDTTKSYYATCSAPMQLAKWLQANVSLTYMCQDQRVAASDAIRRQNLFFANVATTFTLPAKCYIDLSYRYQGRIALGSVEVEPLHFLNASLKKRFGERFTAALTVRNLLFARDQRINAYDDAFTRNMNVTQMWTSRSCQLQLTYNFRSGKSFNCKSVEAGSAEEQGRLQGSGN